MNSNGAFMKTRSQRIKNTSATNNSRNFNLRLVLTRKVYSTVNNNLICYLKLDYNDKNDSS